MRSTGGVLLVLDQPVLIAAIKHTVFSTHPAYDAAEATAALPQWQPHLAIVDMDLVRGDSLDRLGSTMVVGSERIPVLALTRRNDLKTKLAAFEWGRTTSSPCPSSPRSSWLGSWR